MNCCALVSLKLKYGFTDFDNFSFVSYVIVQEFSFITFFADF